MYQKFKFCSKIYQTIFKREQGSAHTSKSHFLLVTGTLSTLMLSNALRETLKSKKITTKTTSTCKKGSYNLNFNPIQCQGSYQYQIVIFRRPSQLRWGASNSLILREEEAGGAQLAFRAIECCNLFESF